MPAVGRRQAAAGAHIAWRASAVRRRHAVSTWRPPQIDLPWTRGAVELRRGPSPAPIWGRLAIPVILWRSHWYPLWMPPSPRRIRQHRPWRRAIAVWAVACRRIDTVWPHGLSAPVARHHLVARAAPIRGRRPTHSGATPIHGRHLGGASAFGVPIPPPPSAPATPSAALVASAPVATTPLALAPWRRGRRRPRRHAGRRRRAAGVAATAAVAVAAATAASSARG